MKRARHLRGGTCRRTSPCSEHLVRNSGSRLLAQWSARISCAGKFVAQGGPSDSLFMVLHGALAVRRTGDLEPIAELRAGELVGEIGFFANVPRTADVIAIRDTSVLVLTRAAYQNLAEDAPAIVEALLAALARRFAKETARLTPVRASPKARTVALIDGGCEPLPSAFDRRMRDGLAA